MRCFFYGIKSALINEQGILMVILKTVNRVGVKEGQVVRFLGSEGRVFRLVCCPSHTDASPIKADAHILSDNGWIQIVETHDIDFTKITTKEGESIENVAVEQLFSAVEEHIKMLYSNLG